MSTPPTLRAVRTTPEGLLWSPSTSGRCDGRRRLGPAVGKRGEVPLCVECRLATTGGGRDGLALGVVDDVAGDVGARGGRGDLDVAVVVQLQLALEQLGARIVADGDEQAGYVQSLSLAGEDVTQRSNPCTTSQDATRSPAPAADFPSAAR